VRSDDGWIARPCHHCSVAARWHHLPPLAIGAVSTGVLLGAAVWDARRNRGWKPQPIDATEL